MLKIQQYKRQRNVKLLSNNIKQMIQIRTCFGNF
jgi:hypothetical protein